MAWRQKAKPSAIMEDNMSNKERITNQLMGREIDRIPLLGGWFFGENNLAELAGMTVNDYLAKPAENLILANRALNIDGLISTPIIPDSRNQIRAARVVFQEEVNLEPEALKDVADIIPDSDTNIIADCNSKEIEKKYRRYIEEQMSLYGDIVYIPTYWEAVPDFHLFAKYGYKSYLAAIGLYPDEVGQIYRESGIQARFRNEILVGLYKEYELVPLLFSGCDICNNAGPMCSPSFLREYYFPWVKYALNPFFEERIKVIRHCDGNVMPLIDDFFDIGYAGFQGFQYECGVDPYKIVAKNPRSNGPLLFMAGLNVTRTLPFGSIEDVQREIDYVLGFTGGGRGLFFFTSSSIGPEVPLENVTFAYDYVANRTATIDIEGKIECTWPGLSEH